MKLITQVGILSLRSRIENVMKEQDGEEYVTVDDFINCFREVEWTN